MSTIKGPAPAPDNLNGSSLRIAIVHARWNVVVINALVGGVIAKLKEHKVDESNIVVQSEQTSYTNDFITSKFTNRGADVTVVEGQYIVTPTAKPFEFQTARKVAKTG